MVDLAPLKSELDRTGEVTLSVKAVPKSSRASIAGIGHDGTLRIKITAAPEKGKANAELCELLAREFAVPRRAVTLLRGETSQLKTIRIVASA